MRTPGPVTAVSKPPFAIVLTAAINVGSGTTGVEDAGIRRAQYLTALRFYARYCPVYFLEHSEYNVLADAEFAAVQNAFLRSIAPTPVIDKGKGYREFHALDAWYDSEQNPPARFLKITGRYLFDNIADLVAEARRADADMALFDRYKPGRFALTSIFCVSWVDYGRYLRGLYRQADDARGRWIEHVVYEMIQACDMRAVLFRSEPDCRGISGSSNTEMRVSRLKYFLKCAARRVNRLLSDQFMFLRGNTLVGLKKLIP